MRLVVKAAHDKLTGFSSRRCAIFWPVPSCSNQSFLPTSAQRRPDTNMASVRALACLVLLAAAFTATTASEEKSEHVVSLGADFDATVNDGNVWFIKFFAPWCGHCKRLAPTWAELGAAVKDNPTIKIAHVDCTVDRDVCSNAEVKGYPTLKVYHKGEEVKAYRGARDLDALKTFVEEQATELLSETTE